MHSVVIIIDSIIVSSSNYCHHWLVSVANWANMLSEPQYLLGLTSWWPAMPGFKSRLGSEFSVGWTNGRYAVRLISRTGTEGPPVSSLNCDRSRLWSYNITAGYKCAYYYCYYYHCSHSVVDLVMCTHLTTIFSYWCYCYLSLFWFSTYVCSRSVTH